MARKASPAPAQGPTNRSRRTTSASPLPAPSKPQQPSATDVAGGAHGGTASTSRGSIASEAPAGLDATRHAAAQRQAHQAEVLRTGVFPALMADALRLDALFETPSYKILLDRLLQEAGAPDDPIEVMLVQQLALAHYRVAQLHARAGHAEGLEAVKILNAAACRLLGEFRRTAIALRLFRARLPEDSQATSFKIHRLAQ